MTSPRKLTAQLELMAGEAAALYDGLCVLEGDPPLTDPHNMAVMEKLLANNAAQYRALWGQDDTRTPRP